MEVGASSFICRIGKRAREQTLVKFMSLNILAPFLIFPYPEAIAEALKIFNKKILFSVIEGVKEKMQRRI